LRIFQISGRKAHLKQCVPSQHNPAALYDQTHHCLGSKMHNSHIR
jgi:hypothetical protein